MSESAPRVFVSYSHDNAEHKSWVLALATRLRRNGIDVGLDQWDLPLGGDLPAFMERGLSSFDRILVVCTREYVTKSNEGKGGVGYEKMILTGAMLQDTNSDAVIPIVRSSGQGEVVPTFLRSKLYIDFRDDAFFEEKYSDLLRCLHAEEARPRPLLGDNPFKRKEASFDPVVSFSPERYLSPAIEGTVSFDYSNNNGRYVFGSGDMLFETFWTTAGSGSIHAYSDPPSIRSVALVTGASEINAIRNAADYDTSSRYRTPRVGEILVWRNTAGYYLATKILAVSVRIPGHTFDELRVEYRIEPLKSPCFLKA